MYNRLAIFFAALMLTVSTAAFAQTAVDVSGRVVRVDPGSQVIILDNNQAFRVTPNTVLLVDNRPATLGTIQPGQAVVIRSGEAVTVLPSAPSAPVTVQAPPPVAAQGSGTTTVIAASPSASPAGLAQQTIYGRVQDVDAGEVKIDIDNDDFEVKVPREVAAQLRKGDRVRLDITFQPSR